MKLEMLDVSRNNIGDDGAISFAAMLRKCPTALPMLKMLIMAGNRIGAAGISALAGCLQDPQLLASIEYISLGDNLASATPMKEALRHRLGARFRDYGDEVRRNYGMHAP